MHATDISETGQQDDYMSSRLPNIGESFLRRQPHPSERQRLQQFQRVMGRTNMVRWTMPAHNREQFRHQPPTLTERVASTPRISPAHSVPDQYIEWQRVKAGRGKANPFNYRWSQPQKRSTLNVTLDSLDSGSFSRVTRRGAASDGDTMDSLLPRQGTLELIGPSPTMVSPHPLRPPRAVKPPGVSVKTFEIPQLCRTDMANAQTAGINGPPQPSKVVHRIAQDQDMSRQQKTSVVTLSLNKSDARLFGDRKNPLPKMPVDDSFNTAIDRSAPNHLNMVPSFQKRAKDPTSRKVRLSGSGRPFLGRFNKLDVFSERCCRITLESPLSSPRYGAESIRRPAAPPPTYRTEDSLIPGSPPLEWKQQQQGAMVGCKLPRKVNAQVIGPGDTKEEAHLAYWNSFARQRGPDNTPDFSDRKTGDLATLCGQRYDMKAHCGAPVASNGRVRRGKKQHRQLPPYNATVVAEETADLCKWARAAIAAHDNDDDIDDVTLVPNLEYGDMTSLHGS